MTARTFCFSREGNWSGGGKALLDNAAFAADLHKALRGDADAVPIIARNVPARFRQKSFLLIPQNAWPWQTSTWTPPDVAKLAALRGLSEVFARRAQSVLRIGESIPVFPADSGELVPNVLDRGFDEAFASSRSGSGWGAPAFTDYFLSYGSMNSYRNLGLVVDGFRLYREGGGTRGLVLMGTPSRPGVVRWVRERTKDLPDVVLRPESVDRPECLALAARASGVVLPSLVEASPVTVLESLAVNPRVILSDIVGHRSILPDGATLASDAYVHPRRPAELARRMHDIPASVRAHALLSDAEFRSSERVGWARRIAGWVERVDSELATRDSTWE